MLEVRRETRLSIIDFFVAAADISLIVVIWYKDLHQPVHTQLHMRKTFLYSHAGYKLLLPW